MIVRRNANVKEINVDMEGIIPAIVRRGTKDMIEPTLRVGTQVMIEPTLQSRVEGMIEASMRMTRIKDAASNALRAEIGDSMLVSVIAREV
jgi:hypothetical protein